MITQKNYMEKISQIRREKGNEAAQNFHQEYYAQFVTPATIAFVKTHIGLQKLQASECPHLNDVVRMNGRYGWIWDRSPMNVQKLRDAGEVNIETASNRTCVGKAAARIILEKAAK